MRVFGMVVALVACAGCLDLSDFSRCASGLVCRDGLVCDEAHNACVTQAQIDACGARAQNEPCLLDVGRGVCDLGVCISSLCGDGIKAIDEACDDGNNMDGDGCNATCTSTETCGNGIVDPTEECDCGDGTIAVAAGCSLPNSDEPGAGCTTTCLAHCGDGEVSALEDCAGEAGVDCLDLGFDAGLVSCAACAYDIRECSSFGWAAVEAQTLLVRFTDIYFMMNGDLLVSTEGTLGAGGGMTIRRDDRWFAVLGAPVKLRAFAGSGDNNIYTVGASNTVYHFDGATWTTITITLPPEVECDWEAAELLDDQLFLGGGCGVYRWDGDNAHLELAVGTPGASFNALEAHGDDLYAIESHNCYFCPPTATLHHRDGAGAWSIVANPVTLPQALASNGTSLFISGSLGEVAQFADDNWVSIPTVTKETLTSIAVSNEDLFVGTSGGNVHRLTGGSWQVHDLPAGSGSQKSIKRLLVTADRAAALATGQTLFDYRGGRVWSTALDFPPKHSLTLPTVAPNGDYFVAGKTGIFKVVEHSLKVAATGADTTRTWNHLWMQDQDSGFALSAPEGFLPLNDRVDVLDGSMLEAMDPQPPGGGSFRILAGFESNLYVATNESTVVVHDGLSWSSLDLPIAESVAQGLAVYDGVLWVALGAPNKSIYSYTGETWQFEYETVGAVISMMAFADGLYVSDLATRVHHFDGTTWHVEETGMVQRILGGQHPLSITATPTPVLYREESGRWIPYRMTPGGTGAVEGPRGILATGNQGAFFLYP